MSKKIICESHLKERITFTYDFPFFLDNVSGLYEKIGSVTGIKSAYSIGESYIDTSIEKRNIVINGIIKSDFINNRNKLYRVFPFKTTGTLYYYEENVAKKIEYKVENVKIEEKGYPKVFQVSLICHYPYFKDIEKSVKLMANWKPMFKFPLKIPKVGIKFGVKNKTSMATILNSSNIELGMTIIFKANDRVVNPSLFNVDTREEIKIEKVMEAGDKIIVTTHRENKNIIYISALNNLEENINYLKFFESKFLQIHIGSNTFRYNADENVENLEATIEYYNEYEAA